ncbi:hypothetical protein [Vibrio sinaloensis]|uniref:hypothetical protein n=1 Tax=Photobacterium sp. (strain ATCC 43367) TaxID=379097 RepID=UPI0022B04DF7|nr:hypothetical protein [Vibrio sinaloensis]MCZ4293278.1 hypothetical protein [Vibrio sinaloensis]
MKWHCINITITAALLITLPFKVLSAHCSAPAWNEILTLQTDLDRTYNLHAQKFNQFLQIHNEQPFLYQEFTPQEIRQFWDSNKDTLHQSMNSQIEASLFVVDKIQLERDALQQLSERAEQQLLRWRNISQHCKQIDNQSNAIASEKYAQLNQALILDINKLFTKLLILEQRYVNEVEALRRARPDTENGPP